MVSGPDILSCVFCFVWVEGLGWDGMRWCLGDGAWNLMLTALRLLSLHHLFTLPALFYSLLECWDGSDCRGRIYVACSCSMVAIVFPLNGLEF